MTNNGRGKFPHNTKFYSDTISLTVSQTTRKSFNTSLETNHCSNALQVPQCHKGPLRRGNFEISGYRGESATTFEQNL
jgi:hypothetical protein